MRFFVEVRCRSTLVVALAAGAGCSGAQSLDTSTVERVTLAELAANPPTGELFGAGSEPLIIHVPAGEEVPLELDVDLPFLTLESGENTVRFERDVHLYVGPGQALISFDGERWARLGDWDAIEEIAGAESGTLSVGFGVSQEQGPLMSVALGMK